MLRTSSRRVSFLSPLLIAALAGCGDDNVGAETGTATGSGTSGTIGSTPGGSTEPTGPGGTEPTGPGGTVGVTEGATGTTAGIVTEGGVTEGGVTTTDPSATGTSAGTTDGTCPPVQVCGGACCAADELCDNGECVPDCGGPPPCGEAKVCCGDGELCYLGECVTPSGACSDQVCATKPDQATCGEGFVCDPALKLCLPSKADPTCQFVPPPSVFEPEPLWTWGRRKAFACDADDDCQVAEACQDKVCAPTWTHLVPGDDDMPNHYQVSSIPLVIDLNDDCVPEVVFNSYVGGEPNLNGALRAVRGDTGAKVWTVSDPAWQTDSTSNPAAGDIDMDGLPEIVSCSEGNTLLAFDSDGTPLWKSEAFTGPHPSGSVAIADMDGEGAPEIVFGAAIFSNTGKKLYEGAAGKGVNSQGPISCVADLDGDGRPELIAGRTAYKTTGTVAGADFAGAVMWSSNVVDDGFCGIADFDKDGDPEVVLVAKAKVHVLDGQTGQSVATANIPQAGNGGPPNIADFNGDGVRDIGVAGSARYTVYLFDGAALTTLWTAVTEDNSSQVTGSSVFDFDGDGRAEVVYNDESYIRIYPGVEPDCQLPQPGPGCDKNMTDAEVLFRDRNSSRTRTEYPVIADVDGNFKADIVFSTNNDTQAALVTDAGVEVFKDVLDNWVSTRPVWNQHTYHITNTGPRGEIPTIEADNWKTPAAAPYNSYRNNVQGAADFCAPDLVPYDLDFDAGVCADQLDVSVWIANQGCLGVGPGVNVAFYEQQLGLLGVVATKGPLVAGAAEQVKLSVPGSFDSVTVWAAADDDGTGQGALNECVEDNNTSPMDKICVPPG